MPWSILLWTYKWWEHFQVSIMKAAGVGMTLTATGLLGLMVAKMVAANSAKINPYLHGSARWANQHDIERAGLLPRPITGWQQLIGKKSV
jgi:type IV secretion system protein VirD4